MLQRPSPIVAEQGIRLTTTYPGMRRPSSAVRGTCLSRTGCSLRAATGMSRPSALVRQKLHSSGGTQCANRGGSCGMSDIFDSKVFCVLPWVHLCGSVDGVWGRCCNDGAMYHDELYSQPEEPAFTLKPDAVGCLPQSRFARANPERALGLEDAFNAANMRRTRLAMLSGTKVDACSYCYAREEGGGESYRQTALALVADDVDVPALIARTGPDGSLDASPIYLDLRFGNA